MADIPPEALKFGWHDGDLKLWVPEEGEPLFTKEEMDKHLADNQTVEQEREEEEEPVDEDLEAEKRADAEAEAKAAQDEAPVPLDPDLLELARNAEGQSNIIEQIYETQAERNANRWKSPTWE